ncbi:Tubulin epsilon chain [Geranomyces variabilis]|uniref:Tubulin epsilon chain n=1 Tax=Geranomyces variabilis TaxID=109894 RepID=A0AAD5TC63_9FUNG|nr:Tubulin epsilon chain [Geranomyces variabilis]
MSNSIVVQVGQCGNQIGSRFWDMCLQEHALHNRRGIYDDALSAFFRNVHPSTFANRPVGDGNGRITGLRARGVMIDMEPAVVGAIARSPLGDLFDDNQRVTADSGSGNNWSVGNCVYGPLYRDEIFEAVRQQAEHCDALQSFFMLSSLGGGTGSGLGSYVCEMLGDEYPDVYRFVAPIVPSGDDDVVTSPYNSILSLSKLIDCADCVLPIENEALLDIHARVLAESKPASGADARSSSRRRTGTALTDSGSAEFAAGGMCASPGRKTHPFDAMNNIAANLLMNMTSSMRFEGTMNVDINDIVTNLVPFPRLKFLLSSMAPLYTLSSDPAAAARPAPRRLDQMFLDAFARDTQLVRCEPKGGRYLACALIARGDVEISDLRRNIERMSTHLRFPDWNREAWKIGLCSVPPLGQANLHHYTANMDVGDIAAASENVRDLVEEYASQEFR